MAFHQGQGWTVKTMTELQSNDLARAVATAAAIGPSAAQGPSALNDAARVVAESLARQPISPVLLTGIVQPVDVLPNWIRGRSVVSRQELIDDPVGIAIRVPDQFGQQVDF